MLKLKERIVDLKPIYEPSEKLLRMAEKYGVGDARHDIDWKVLFEMRKDFGSDSAFIEEVLIPAFIEKSQKDKTQILEINIPPKKELQYITDEKEKEELEAKQKKAEEKELELIEHIKQNKTPELDKYYEDLDVYLKILESVENITGLLLIGDAGCGKTTYIRKRYKGTNVLLSGHITPKELYLSYLNHPNGHIIIDDPSSIYSNIDSLGLLLQATQTEPIRTIHWHTSTLKVPKTTTFYGKTTLIQNYEPNNDILESRCLIKHLHFDFDTKIKMLYEFANVINSPLEIVDEIKSLKVYGDAVNKRISFRTVQKLLAFYNNDKNWKNRIYEVVGLKDERIKLYNLVLELNKKHRVIKDMEEEFLQETKMSRAQFYLLRSDLSLSHPYTKKFK